MALPHTGPRLLPLAFSGESSLEHIFTSSLSNASSRGPLDMATCMQPLWLQTKAPRNTTPTWLHLKDTKLSTICTSVVVGELLESMCGCHVSCALRHPPM